MKLGIIRCMQTEDYCPGSRDFRTIRERKGAFEGEDDIQLVGFINCGGCPGKKAVLCSPAQTHLPGGADEEIGFDVHQTLGDRAPVEKLVAAAAGGAGGGGSACRARGG